MIEVLPDGNRWRWQMICWMGRVLVYNADRFDSDTEANEAAKRYRSTFWRVADQVDHRMARCF